MPDYLKLFNEKEKLDVELRQRYINDVHLRDLLRYVMTDALMKPLSGIINVTLNKPAVFYANVFSALNGAHEKIEVKSEDKEFDTHYVEDFRKAGFASANTRLSVQDRFEIDPYIDEQVCMRGRAGGLVLFQVKKEKLVSDIRMWDMGYVSYEVGDEG